MDSIKFILEEERPPKYWYNIQADLKTPLAPPIHPGTKQPITPDDLAPWVAMADIPEKLAGTFTEHPIKGTYDAIIIAVGHSQFTELGANTIRSYGNKNMFYST